MTAVHGTHHHPVGLVLRGRHPGAATRWQHSLGDVTQMAAEAFPKFWVTDTKRLK